MTRTALTVLAMAAVGLAIATIARRSRPPRPDAGGGARGELRPLPASEPEIDAGHEAETRASPDGGGGEKRVVAEGRAAPEPTTRGAAAAAAPVFPVPRLNRAPPLSTLAELAAKAEASAEDAGPLHRDREHESDRGELSGPPILIGMWTFEESGGSISADVSGEGHPALLLGGATFIAAGKHGRGLALDGETGYADVGVTLIDTSRSYSMALWLKPAVVGPWAIALSQDAAMGSLFSLKIRGDNQLFDFNQQTSDQMSPGFVVAQSRTAPKVGTWTHLAAVFAVGGPGAGTELRLYVDGVLESTAAWNQPPLAPGGSFFIGGGLYNGVPTAFFDGVIDDVEVYSGALSNAEVAAVYAGQRVDSAAGATD